MYASARTGSLILATTFFDAEQLFGRELRGEGVAVVALGQREEPVGAVRADPPQHVLVRAVGADRLAREVRLEPVERVGVDVDDRDVVARPGEALGQAGADPAAADDHRSHRVHQPPGR